MYIFIPETGSLSLEEYPEKITKYFKLKKINKLSSYCNSYDSLFISGGIYNKEEIKDFWIVNNQNFKIEKKLMPNPKSNHSMIYIEINNNQIIFFIGGNDLSTFYYDINNKNFVLWGNISSSSFSSYSSGIVPKYITSGLSFAAPSAKTKALQTTSPPAISTSFSKEAKLPPVEITSSTMATFFPSISFSSCADRYKVCCPAVVMDCVVVEIPSCIYNFLLLRATA